VQSRTGAPLMTIDCRQFFINGQWHSMAERPVLTLLNPATEQPHANVSLGTAAEYRSGSRLPPAPPSQPGRDTSVAARLDILERIIAGIMDRTEELALAILHRDGLPCQFRPHRPCGQWSRPLRHGAPHSGGL